jgi:Polyketide cyclase / dehydrase and lipid transport
MQTLDHDSASIEIDAPPQVMFNLITDIHQMARFSPEVVSCRWLDGADRAALGARFEAVNQVPGHRPWKNRPVVTVYESQERFAISRTEPFAGTIVWAYDLDSDGNKTVLTESYRVTKAPEPHRLDDHRERLRRARPRRRPQTRHSRHSRRDQSSRRVNPKPAASHQNKPSR